MGLNETVSAERTHIAFFGLRNAGKSSMEMAFRSIHKKFTFCVSLYDKILADNVKSASTHYFVPYYPFGYCKEDAYEYDQQLSGCRHTGYDRRKI